MDIEYHPPAAHGVSTLMYVGDADIGSTIGLSPLELAAAIVGAVIAGYGAGWYRWVGAYVAADMVLRASSRRR